MQQCAGFSFAVHFEFLRFLEILRLFALEGMREQAHTPCVHVAREFPHEPVHQRKAGGRRFVMDMSEMITGFLVALVITILVIDTIMDWRAPSQARRQLAVAAGTSGQHSLDPKIACDIVWC
ncbi:hypothetical protein ACMDCR_18950 [Labrys okinawensis]|uniref:hypothetical protein n=1 Tax=Labrys okinawensis TaxID=346911 RepID=UPI0039BC6EF8